MYSLPRNCNEIAKDEGEQTQKDGDGKKREEAEKGGG